jgi:hypothetical protein
MKRVEAPQRRAKELIHRRSWSSRRELSAAVFEYIEAFYNRERRHSTLGMLSPADFEKLLYAVQGQNDRTTEKIKSMGVVLKRGKCGVQTPFDPRPSDPGNKKPRVSAALV